MRVLRPLLGRDSGKLDLCLKSRTVELLTFLQHASFLQFETQKKKEAELVHWMAASGWQCGNELRKKDIVLFFLAQKEEAELVHWLDGNAETKF